MHLPKRNAQKDVDDLEVYHSISTAISLTFSGGSIKTREHDVDMGYGVRVLKDKKVGFSYCENADALDDATKRALKTSKFSPESPFNFQGAAKTPEVKILDKNVEMLEAKKLKEILNQMRDGAEKYSTLSRIIISAHKETYGLKNTCGFVGSYHRSELGAYAEVMDGNGSGFSQYSSNFMIEDPAQIGLRAAEMAKDMRYPEKIKAGKYTVIAGLETLNSIFDVFLPSFSGDWERRKISKLFGKRDKKLFSESFSLADDGKHKGMGARPFDDEGSPSKRKVLVEKGVLKSFVYDRQTAALASAALAGRKDGGCCNRSHYSTSPSNGFSNLVVKPGDYTDLEDELGKCIIVQSAHGAHTANLTTGDFGLEVNVAFLKKGNKKKLVPVRGFMLIGNVFKLFKSIEGIEKKQKIYTNLVSPRIAFKNVQVVS